MSEAQTIRPAGEWLALLEAGPLVERLAEAHGPDESAGRGPGAGSATRQLGTGSFERGESKDKLPAVAAPLLNSYRAVLERFVELYGSDRRCLISRAPARINLMGMHIDHRGGCINPIAIKETTLVAAAREDDRVTCENVRGEKYPRREFAISEELPRLPIEDWDAWTRERVAEREQAGTAGDWSNYVRAPVLYLQDRRKNPDGTLKARVPGMDLVYGSVIPEAAGLSSSSALVVSTLQAALHFAEIEVSGGEFIDLCGAAEWYVGTRGGKGDHASIKFGQRGAISHMRFFPFDVRSVPLPDEYRVVICNSLQVARKSAGAKDRFNERVACYVIGLALIQTRFPQHADALTYFRDIHPKGLGVSEAEIYRMIRALPEVIDRTDALKQVNEKYRDELERIFQSHVEPEGGYEVRQVTMYGVAECLRAEYAAALLEAGDVQGFGRLIDISHEGDRVVDAGGSPVSHRLSDGDMDALIAKCEAAPEDDHEARLLWQPGGYDCSSDALDRIVDISRGCEGVAGAGLVGAGLGGCVVVIVEKDHADGLVAALTEKYYKPKGLDPAVEVVSPVEGACLVRV